jgi:hypothetical protein
MSKKEYDEIFAKHSRESEPVTLPLERFTIDGDHVCLSWSGYGSHPRMCCQFLFTERFGTRDVCGYLGVYIHDNNPDEKCPLRARKEVAGGQE